MQQSVGVLDDQILLQVRLRRFMNWFLASFTTLAVLISIVLLRTPAPALNGMLLGAEAVLVGVRPEVAQTMVGLGLALPGLRAYADLQTAVGPLSACHR